MYFVKRSQQKMPYKSQNHLKVLILLDILGFAFIGILRELAVCSWGGWDEQTHYHLYYLLVFVSDASRPPPVVFCKRCGRGFRLRRGFGGQGGEDLQFFSPESIGQNFFQKFWPSKKVRAKFSIFDQVKLCKFFDDAASERSSSAERFASKSKGFLKSQETVFSERRRFGIAKQFTNAICFQFFPFRLWRDTSQFFESRA